MCRLIEKAASDAGIRIDSANTIFTVFAKHLVDKVPELAQVVEDVFEDNGEELLKLHINRAASLIQQHEADKYKSWSMPLPQAGMIKHAGKGELF